MDLVRGAASLLVIIALAFMAPAFAPTPAAAQDPGAEAGETLVVEDAVGDVGPFGIGVEGNPAMVAYQHIDITEVGFGGDDAEAIQMRLGVVGFDPVPAAVAQAAAAYDFSCELEWTFADPPKDMNYFYTLSFNGDLLRIPDGPPETIHTSMRLNYAPEERFFPFREYAPRGSVTVTYDPASSSFVAEVPKTFTPVWPGGQVPHKGDSLIFRSAICWTDLTLYGRMVDNLFGEDSDRYALTAYGPGDSVTIRFADQHDPETGADIQKWRFPETADAPTAAVPPGTATTLPLVLHNEVDTRKLVALAASSAPPGWNVTVAPSVFLTGNETRTINLFITPPRDAPIGTTERIDISAQVVGEEGRGVASRLLNVKPAIGPAHNTFHLHLEPRTEPSVYEEALAMVVGPSYEVAVSLLPTMEGYADEPAEVSPVRYWSDGHRLDPLIRPVRLDTEAPIRIQVALQGDASREVRVEMSLSSPETGTVFSIDEDLPADGLHEIITYVHGDGIVTLPPGIQLYYDLNVGPGLFTEEETSSATLDPKQTTFTLPVVDDTQDVVVTDGRFLPSLSLSAEEDATTYINPGKQYTYDLVLANDGIETDDLSVRVNATNATGWGIEILPGSSFRVSPGNSTPVAVAITAPSDAAEGAHPRFEVVAVSKNDKAVRTTIQLDAIVTSGVDIDSKTYAEKEGQLPPLTERVEEGPGLGWLPLVLALGALLQRRRLRR